MHSSTSSSSGAVFARSLPEAKRWRQILLGTILLLTTELASVECYARSTGTPPQFETTPDLWVTQWYRFEESPKVQTVIIGASRNKFGLILNRWEELTKVQPIMLAWPGSPPHPVLELLAENREFSGAVIFVRHPSSGKMLEFEKMHYLRELYFDRLIAETGCMGIHFEDYPEIFEYDYTEKITQIIEGQQTLKESTNVGKPE